MAGNQQRVDWIWRTIISRWTISGKHQTCVGA